MQENFPQDYILGLDIGVNSVGWAVVTCKKAEQGRRFDVTGLEALNSYIFSSAVDAKKEVPLNVERRQNRLMRRQTSRRKHRRKLLFNLLQQGNLVPSELNESAANDIDCRFALRKAGIDIGDDASATIIRTEFANLSEEEKRFASPFAMRSCGLDEELRLHEIGRILMQMQKQRGYRSNRGAKFLELIEHLDLNEVTDNEEEKDVDLRVVLGGIGELKKRMAEESSRTVGEWIWQEAQRQGEDPKRITGYSIEGTRKVKEEEKKTKVGLYAQRDMTMDEFKLLWKKQKEYHSLILTEELEHQVRTCLFKQNPIQNPPPRRLRHLRYNLVGKCVALPRENRAPKALLPCQHFRILKTINNIRIGGAELNHQQRRILIDIFEDPQKMNNQGKISVSKINSALGVKKMNFEMTDDKDGLVGNRTKRGIVNIIGEKWQQFSDDRKEQLIRDIHCIPSKKDLYSRLEEHWGFEEGKNHEACQLAFLEFEPGYMGYCLKIIKRSLPYLQEGKNEHDAINCATKDLRVKEATGVANDDDKIKPEDVPHIANPRVDRALGAVRRVVNAIIKRYGRPVEVRVEMARDLKASKEKRKEIRKEQGANRKLNEEVDSAVREHARSGDGVYRLGVNRMGVKYVDKKTHDKYKIWEYEQKHECLYCGKCISKIELFDEVELDHIIPRSLLQQNYNNLVVACRNCNREKKNQTPYQWKGHDEDEWKRFKERVNSLWKAIPKAKRLRLLKESDPMSDEEFTKGQLQDTQYIAKMTYKMLSGNLKINVSVGRGGATAILRRTMGLNNILPRHPDDEPVVNEHNESVRDKDKDKESKNRKDHRHHAIDAFVVAMTDSYTLQKLTLAEQNRNDNRNQESFSDIWRSLGGYPKKIVREQILNAVVPHQKFRKIKGPLHKDSIYGRAHYSRSLGDFFSTAKGNKSKKLKELLDTHVPNEKGEIDADGNAYWLPDFTVRKEIEALLQQVDVRKARDFSLPDHLLKAEVRYRAYVRRIPIKDAIEYAKKEKWEPGNKRWIAHKDLHEILHYWLVDHNLADWSFDANKVKELLSRSGPLTRSKKGAGNSVNSVRVMMNKSEASVRVIRDNHTVELGSNHHLEIFSRFENGSEKLSCRIVSMFDAARRCAKRNERGEKMPIVDKSKMGWNYKMSLAINDMVVFNDNIVAGLEKHKMSGLYPPIYRVQKFTCTKHLIIHFRHFSVSTAGEGDPGLLRICSEQDLAGCQKIEMDILGNLSLKEGVHRLFFE